MLKGIDREVISEVLTERAEGSAGRSAAGAGAAAAQQELDEADEVAAGRLLERRAASLRRDRDPRRRRQKAYALLARNGFDPGICARVAAAFVASIEPGVAPDEGDSDAV